ncbi:MAG: hypothetical protein ACYC6Y_16205 [Thermoguttaceae bacterium]
MTVTSNEEFAKRMMLLAEPAERFKPTATYDPEGDCIEFLVSPDPFYAERVDDLVTVYYSQGSNEVIGSQIKGVAKFCKNLLQRMPGFKIEIRDGRVSLEHIFRAKLWSASQDPQAMLTLAYQKLIAMAEQSEVEVDTGELCMV